MLRILVVGLAAQFPLWMNLSMAATISLEATLTTGPLPSGCSIESTQGPDFSVKSMGCVGLWGGPSSMAQATANRMAFAAVAGNNTNFAPDVAVSATSRARLSETFTVSGGVGQGTLLIEYRVACGGSNQAMYSRPLVSVTNGAANTETSRSGILCDPRFGALDGTLAIPFEFGISNITLTLDTLEVQSMKSTLYDRQGRREVYAQVRVLDTDFRELTDAIAVPEPATVVAGVTAGSLLVAHAVRGASSSR